MINDKDLRKQFQEHYRISKQTCKNQYKHIDDCQAFYAGDSMKYKDQAQFGRGGSRRIKTVEFNRVKPYVNSIVGFMAQMRCKPDYQAKLESEQEQGQLSDYLNGYSEYIRDNANADQIETKQDMDLVIGGVGLTDTAVTLKAGTPTRDPNGEVVIERVDPRHCGWDGLDTTPNLLGSRWVYRAKDYDLEEAIELFDADEDDFEVKDADDDITNFEFNPYGGIQDKIGYEFADPQRRMVRVYFYQWFEIESFDRVENPLTQITDINVAQLVINSLEAIAQESDDSAFMFNPKAETLVVTKDLRSKVKELFDFYDIDYDPITEKRRAYYTAILSGDKIFTKYKSPSQQGFSMKFKTGDYDDVNKMWTGIVASMRMPQRYYNKALTELMLIIANNSRGGVMYEKGAIDNVQEFESKWAMTNAAVEVEDGALSGGKIQPKATPKMDSGYEGILAVSGENLSKVTGIDESFFGAIAGGNETAMLQRQRIKQATTTLALYFDSIALYSKEQAEMMLSFMRLLAESGDGALFRISDDDGNPLFEKLSLDFFADEYEISIGESPETPVQKEYYTQTLIQMAQSMQAIGDPRYLQMYASAVKYMPLPNKDKNAIVEILVGQEKIDPAMVQQLQAKVQQLEGQQAQVMNARMMAEIERTQADTQEKLVKAKKTEVEIGGVLEDTESKSIENDIMASKNYDDVNVTI